jgi:cell division control protein 6
MKNADTLDVIFENFLCSKSIFKDRNVLRHDYVPSKLPHRETQIKFLGMIVAPLLRTERCSNIFIYGKPGTGKTAVMKYVLKKLTKKASEMGAAVQVGYVNCRLAGTQYRVLTTLCEILRTKIPFTGLALGEVFDRFKNVLEKQAVLFVAVLDEIDEFVKNRGDDLLYELTRVNESLKNSKISLVGISNNLGFKNLLDPRVLSCLGEEEVVFRPYNASELQDILWERADLAFQDNVLSKSAVGLCAALAAAEHGDARRALDLLRVAGEVAERDGFQTITEHHVRIAEERIEYDRTMQTLANLTKHSKFVLYSVYLLGKANVHSAITGDIYEVYNELCNEIGSPSLTQRRVSGLINELDTIGLLNARLVSRGRYGRTKKISLAIPRTPVKEIYSKDDHLSMLQKFTPTCLQTRRVENRRVN